MESSYDDGVSSERERSTGGGGGWVARLAPRAPELLRHVSLLLAMWGAAGLATGTRLQWNVLISLKVYRAGAVLLPLLSVLLLALGHLVLVALRRRSRALLLLYAVLMTLVAVAGDVGATWAIVEMMRLEGLLRDYLMLMDEPVNNHRSRRSIKSDIELENILEEFRRNTSPIFGHAAEFAEAILVRLRVAAALLAVLVVLQAAAVLLALLASYDITRPGIYPISKDALASWWSQCRCDMGEWGRSVRARWCGGSERRGAARAGAGGGGGAGGARGPGL